MGRRHERAIPHVRGLEQGLRFFYTPSCGSEKWGHQSYVKRLGNNNSVVVGESAKATVGYADAGQIDEELRYSPPRATAFMKTGLGYSLVLGTLDQAIFESNDSPLKQTDGRIPGWRIEGAQFPETRWTTVNTAIRYVLTMSRKTTDSAIKANADNTLKALLRSR